MSADPKELEKRMQGAMDALKKELGGLRTGRASVNLLEPVMVEAYGQRMALNRLLSAVRAEGPVDLQLDEAYLDAMRALLEADARPSAVARGRSS